MILLLALLIILAFIGLIAVLIIFFVAWMSRIAIDAFDPYYDPYVVNDEEIEKLIQKDIKRKKKKK